MSDFNSSLPIRTETNGDVVVKVVDGTVTSQALAVDAAGKVYAKLNDGSGNDITSQANGAQRALDVGINVAGVQIDPRQVRALTAADVVTVEEIVQPLPAGTNLLGGTDIYVGGVIASDTNPVPVSMSAAPLGDVVNNYNTAAALAAAGTSNHTYTITSTKSFQGKKIHAASSGKLKIEVQTSPDGVAFSTIFVAFNSTATPNIDVDMDQILFLQAAGTGAAIRVIRTNKDSQAQDVYSTISGIEV